MADKVPDFGESWVRVPGYSRQVRDRRGEFVADTLGTPVEYADRAIECLNVCAGLDVSHGVVERSRYDDEVRTNKSLEGQRDEAYGELESLQVDFAILRDCHEAKIAELAALQVRHDELAAVLVQRNEQVADDDEIMDRYRAKLEELGGERDMLLRFAEKQNGAVTEWAAMYCAQQERYRVLVEAAQELVNDESAPWGPLWGAVRECLERAEQYSRPIALESPAQAPEPSNATTIEGETLEGSALIPDLGDGPSLSHICSVLVACGVRPDVGMVTR